MVVSPKEIAMALSFAGISVATIYAVPAVVLGLSALFFCRNTDTASALSIIAFGCGSVSYLFSLGG